APLVMPSKKRMSGMSNKIGSVPGTCVRPWPTRWSKMRRERSGPRRTPRARAVPSRSRHQQDGGATAKGGVRGSAHERPVAALDLDDHERARVETEVVFRGVVEHAADAHEGRHRLE